MTGTWDWWERLTTADFSDIHPPRTVALVPVGAIEQHGPHLPLGTDALIADAVVEGALARTVEPLVLRLPTERIGLSPEHASFPGTLTRAAETLIAAWTETGRSVRRAGVRKLIIVNGHGGQPQVVDLVAQRLRAETGMLVARVNLQRAPVPDGWLDDDERRYGLHGGRLETSLMLAIAPDLVRRDRLARFVSTAERFDREASVLRLGGDPGVAWMAEDLNLAGAVGDARAADGNLGLRILDHWSDWLARIIADVQRAGLPTAEAGTAPSGSERP
jgi:creatinine amidohydrolase